MPNGQRQRATAWVFTLNNYTSEEEQAIKGWVGEKLAKFACFGREQGENGTPHLQGYVEFCGKKSLSTLRRINGRIHWERRKGSAKQAIDYCKKDGDFWQEGVCSGQGRRSDLAKIKEAIEEGKDEAFIANEYFNQWVVYRRSFAAYRSLLSTKRTWKSFINVIWGDTGMGKTRLVFDLHKDDDVFVYPGGGWFDGYTGQQVVLFDDFRGSGSGVEVGFLLRLLDRYPMQVPIKGGFVPWVPKKIYITSNCDPTDWYTLCGAETRRALFRRLERIDHVTESIYLD